VSREPLAVAAVALLAFGCGQVGEPLPPLLNIPGKVTDFRVAQVADKAELRWTWPLLTTEGSTLKDLEKFEVFALDVPADSGPPPVEAFEQLGKPVAVVEGDELPATGAGATVATEIDLSDRLEKHTAFAVRGVSSRGRTGPWSEFAMRNVLRPVAAPAKPDAESTAGGVELRWDPVERAARYIVERRAGEDAEYQAVATTETPGFVDASAPLDKPLEYRVLAQVGEGDGAVPSQPSATSRITHRDTFPPAVPGNLRAVATADGVELTWSAARDPDLQGYEVIRNSEPAHEGLLQAPAFHDASAKREGANEYRVRSVDQKGNRSELSEAATATLP
jgi:hypothetical protein